VKRIIKTLIPLALAAGLTACGSADRHEQPDLGGRVIQVVTTTGQVADLVASVGGARVEVRSLMGPGIDPHQYKASARDVERLRQADVVFYSGLHLESKLADVLERLGDTKTVVPVTEGIPESRLISPAGFQGAHDPHVWFDASLWRLTIPVVADNLADLDPGHAAQFQARALAYAASLDSLHAYAARQFATIPEQQRVMITAHDAFNYLGRAYGLQVRGLQGISTASEAGTRDVQELAVFIAERRIPALFVETSVSPRAVNAVREAVRARGFEVIIGGSIYSDALGDPGTPVGTYVGMFRHNIDTITSALRGEGAHAGH
jgi:manganese/zinc/iron transport system substrate-binding protein